MPQKKKASVSTKKKNKSPDISCPAIQRIMHRAGITRINGEVYDSVRKVMRNYIQDIIYKN